MPERKGSDGLTAKAAESSNSGEAKMTTLRRTAKKPKRSNSKDVTFTATQEEDTPSKYSRKAQKENE